MDFMTHTHRAQAVLAEELAHRFRERLGEHPMRELAAVAEKAGIELDRDAAQKLLEREISRDVLRVVSGFTDWLATTVWLKVRSGSSRRAQIPLPRASHDELVQLGRDYDVEDPDVVRQVLELICSGPTRLPAVGHIDGGQLTPDYESLARWAEHYDWSE